MNTEYPTRKTLTLNNNFKKPPKQTSSKIIGDAKKVFFDNKELVEYEVEVKSGDFITRVRLVR